MIGKDIILQIETAVRESRDALDLANLLREEVESLRKLVDLRAPRSPYDLSKVVGVKRPKILDELAAMDEDVKEEKRHA